MDESCLRLSSEDNEDERTSCAREEEFSCGCGLPLALEFDPDIDSYCSPCIHAEVPRIAWIDNTVPTGRPFWSYFGGGIFKSGCYFGVNDKANRAQRTVPWYGADLA